jgi:hypothetical protein
VAARGRRSSHPSTAGRSIRSRRGAGHEGRRGAPPARRRSSGSATPRRRP